MKKYRIILAFLMVISLLTLCAACSKPADTAAGSVPAAPAADTGASAPPEAVQPTEENAPSAEETAPQNSRNTALDDAFAAGESFRLAPVDLPSGDLGENRTAIGLSPDGQTVLWRTWEDTGKERLYSLSLVRNGETIPVTFTAERGAGDPYEKASFITGILTESLPGTEGLSWSADGSRIALSHVYLATQLLEGPDVSVIDTATGELYQAAGYRDGREAFLDGSYTGLVLLNRIDRSGRYCYYLLMTPDAYRFCRCPAEGGTAEILYETPYNDDRIFEIDNYSTMTELSDGSWLLTGVNGNSTRNRLEKRLSLIRFVPSGDTWTAEITPSGIMCERWAFRSFACSVSSGYSIACVRDLTSIQSHAMALTADSASAELAKSSLNPLTAYVNLLRIGPESSTQQNVWWLKDTGDDTGRLEAMQGEPYLWSVKGMAGSIPESETEEANKWVLWIDPGTGQPFGYDPVSASRDGNGRRTVTCLCLSPDGYYALASASDSKGGQAFWLISLETMQARSVTAPESYSGDSLGAFGFTSYYGPQMTWNDDGTLLILNTGTKCTEAFRLEYGPAAE